MPIRKRCKECGVVIRGGAKRNALCSKCEDTIYSTHRKRKAEQYNYQWRKTSLAFRDMHPLCAMCLIKDGVAAPVELTDHIVPLSDDMRAYPYADPNDFDNLAPLCGKHHAQKTVLVDREYFKGNYEPLKQYKALILQAKEQMR